MKFCAWHMYITADVQISRTGASLDDRDMRTVLRAWSR